MKGITVPNFNLSGEVIAEVYKIQYLGHYITNDLFDDDDIKRQVRKLYALGNVILRKFHMCSWYVKITVSCILCTIIHCPIMVELL